MSRGLGDVYKRQEQTDSADRVAIRGFRDTIREKRDREEEDGVVLTTAFKRRGALVTPYDTSDESGPEKPGRSSITPENLKRIWADKCQSPAYQMMLVSILITLDESANSKTSNHECSCRCGLLRMRSCGRLIGSKL